MSVLDTEEDCQRQQDTEGAFNNDPAKDRRRTGLVLTGGTNRLNSSVEGKMKSGGPKGADHLVSKQCVYLKETCTKISLK